MCQKTVGVHVAYSTFNPPAQDRDLLETVLFLHLHLLGNCFFVSMTLMLLSYDAVRMQEEREITKLNIKMGALQIYSTLANNKKGYICVLWLGKSITDAHLDIKLHCYDLALSSPVCAFTHCSSSMGVTPLCSNLGEKDNSIWYTLNVFVNVISVFGAHQIN